MRNFVFVLVFLFFSISLFGQPQCRSLGCAKNYGTQNATNQPQAAVSNLGCLNPYQYRQIFWQFFYSPSGGNYTQTITSTGTDLDWIVMDIGTSLPSINCPINSAAWTSVTCNYAYTTTTTGPGVDGTVATTTGHYYAFGVAVWDAGTYTFTIGTPQIAGANLTPLNCPASGPLPLTLLSFIGKVNTDKSYSLAWQTENEVNVSHFEILKSYDGINWLRVTDIVAKNLSLPNNYSYTDSSLLKGILYVKLKIVDVNGAFIYSSIVALKSKDKGLVLVNTGQNPVNDKLNYLIFSPSATTVNLIITDAAGRKIKIEKIKLTENDNVVQVPVAGLSAGVYFVNIIDPSNGDTIARRFQKI